MTDDIDRPLEERFLGEMVAGYLDGRKPDNPEPSANRSFSYRHGFANGRDDLARSPRMPAQMLRPLTRHLAAFEKTLMPRRGAFC
jgi:hypothetical protein